jgi:NRPS condensation-like uncharacterized protein
MAGALVPGAPSPVDSERPTDDAPATLQDRLEDADDDRCELDAGARIGDPVALLHHLDVSGHFHRDSRVGRIFHRGMVSLRETEPADSLHVSVHGNRLLAHVDGVSPLTVGADGSSTYSVRRALTHNLAGMAQDLLWLLRGRQGDHRSELSCEWLSPEAARAARDLHLLEPETGAWSVQMDARVAGTLDEERLRAALRSVLGLAAIDPDPLTVVDCNEDGALGRARADLSQAPARADDHPPLRACLARHGDGDVLMLGLNHAASDGFGALQVMRTIARAYAGDGSTPQLDFLATRELPVRPAPGFTSAPARAYRRAVERMRDTRERPARLAEDDPGDDVGCGYHLVSLTAAETRGAVGVEPGRANTDVLLAALHLAIEDWNDRHGSGGRSIAVLVQADLRPPEWREAPIANFSVVARVSTTPRDRSSPASTLETISAEIARNKRMRTGVALIAALERSRLLGLWAKQSVIVLAPLTGNLIDTTVLCNLGSLDEAPSFGPDAGEAVELWFSTPARAPLSLCLGAVTVGGRLHLSFRYPHRLLGPGAARRFADCYVEHLRQVGEARRAR